MALSLKDVFDLELFAANAGCLVPMDFGPDDFAVGKAHLSNSFPLPPSSAAIPLAQTLQLANSRTGGYRLDLPYRADDLELHAPMLSEIRAPGNTLFLRGK